MPIQITYSHSSTRSSSAKRFAFGLTEDTIITEKVPPQLQQIIECISYLAEEQSTFTYNDIISYVDALSEIDNSTFTRSKGGTERIVRYYGKLLQELDVLVEPHSVDTEIDFNDD